MAVTRTFLFTDIEGSTRSEQSEPVAWVSNHARHNVLIEEIVRANHGEPYKNTGDGYQAAFINAPDALKAALDIQRKIADTAWEGSTPIRVRMGLHTGEAQANGSDYLGDDLHRVARLMDAGHGGQVLLSLVTTELVQDALRRDPALSGVELRELGVYSLRDLKRPERIFQMVAPGLRSDFPLLRIENAYFTNLPEELEPFVGRREELNALRDELAKTRLLTVTGAGGVGKTRIALRLAREAAPDHKDGVGLVELASLSDPDLVVQTTASVFGVGESGSTPLKETLIYYLQKKSMLLVFDNCEHLLDACADFISALLGRSSGLKVLVTSRERLDIDGETVYNLPMMAVPRVGKQIRVDDLHAYPALELFVTAATNAGAELQVTERNVNTIAAICEHLDGNALAIKLAASLTPTLAVEEILSRLRERFEVLVQGRRQAMPRHRTLKAAIDWSYDLLSPGEAELFRGLAVFAGSWSLKAAERVCPGDGFKRRDVMPSLNNLVRKNLVTKVRSDDGEAGSRFGMLETVREYARLKLQSSGERDRLRQRHAEYFAALANETGPAIWGPEPRIPMGRLERDYDDLVSALEWICKNEAAKESGLGLQMAAALGPFWERRGFLSEGRERLAQALRCKKRAEHDKFRLDALEAAGRLAFLQNDYIDTIDLYEKSLKIRRQRAATSGSTTLQHGVAGLLNKIGIAAVRKGDYTLAKERLLEAMEISQQTKHTRGTVRALDYLAELAWRQGDYEGAKARYMECLKYAAQQKGSQQQLTRLDSLKGQAKILMLQGKYDEAATLFSACLDIGKALNDKQKQAYSLSDMSEVAFQKGDYETAEKYAEESLALRQEVRHEWGIASSMHRMAQAEHKLGRCQEALEHLKESLLIFERLDYRKGIAECLLRTAAIKLDMGEKDTAARLFGAAEALLDSLGPYLAEVQRDHYERAQLAEVRGQLDSAAWMVGQITGMEAAIQLAMKDPVPA